MGPSPEMKRTSVTGAWINERLIALTLRTDRKDKAEPAQKRLQDSSNVFG